MKVATKPFRLAVRWNAREQDAWAECTPRFTNGDLRYILDVLNRDVLAELERRGYDLRTMRFWIDKTPEAIAEHQKIKQKSESPDAR